MIKELVKLATHLDKKGYRREASYLDSVMNKLAQDTGYDADILGPTDTDLSAIEMGNDMTGEAPHLEESLDDSGEEFIPSILESILGGDIAIDILDNRDADALWRGIKLAPPAMADWFYDTMKASSGEKNMDALAMFARHLGEKASSESQSSDDDIELDGADLI